MGAVGVLSGRWPVSAGEVEGVVAVEVDVLVREQRDVLDLAAGDQLAGAAELVEDPLGVDRVPDDRQQSPPSAAPAPGASRSHCPS